MKKVIAFLTTQVFVIAVYAKGRPHYEIQEQSVCKTQGHSSINSIELVSGQKKVVGKDKAGYDILEVSNSGSLKITYHSGKTETLVPVAGVGGLFGEFKFPDHFMVSNSAQNPHILRFTSDNLGAISVSSVCYRPNSLYCGDRSGFMASKSVVSVNLNGEELLKFNGRPSSQALCDFTYLN